MYCFCNKLHNVKNIHLMKKDKNNIEKTFQINMMNGICLQHMKYRYEPWRENRSHPNGKVHKQIVSRQ